jgi:hypothetical protein
MEMSGLEGWEALFPLQPTGDCPIEPVPSSRWVASAGRVSVTETDGSDTAVTGPSGEHIRRKDEDEAQRIKQEEEQEEEGWHGGVRCATHKFIFGGLDTWEGTDESPLQSRWHTHPPPNS